MKPSYSISTPTPIRETRSGTAEQITRWFADSLCVEDNRLQRTGEVCPSLAPALKEGLVFYSEVNVPSPIGVDVRDWVFRVGLESSRTFQDVICQSSHPLFALVVALPELSPSQCRYGLEGALRLIRLETLPQRVMVGCFHEYYNRPSRLNHEFFSMRSPVPMLALRRLFPFDRRSLSDNIEYVEIFDRLYPGSAHE